MKIPFWGTILTIISVIILCKLGFWQLDRLQWKTKMLNAIKTEYARNAAQTPLSNADLAADIKFKRGYMIGEYDHEKEILIQSQTNKGMLGYHLLSPFYLFPENKNESKAVILVNRGWIPINREMPENGKIERPENTIKITGMLKKPPAYNMFVPENNPDQDIWYRIDLSQIAKSKEIKEFIPYIFHIETESQNEQSGNTRYPVATAIKQRINNNHAQYALFWFSMSAVMIIIYILRFFYSDLK